MEIGGQWWHVCLQSEKELQRVMNEFYSVYKRRKLTVNARKNKLMVFERREVEVVDLSTIYRVSVPAVGRCEVVLGEKMEEVKELKYLITVLYKHGWMEG